MSAIALVTALLAVPAGQDQPSADAHFPWRIVAYGDNRGANATHRRLLQTVRRLDPDIILNAGDYISAVRGGSFAEYKRDVEQCFGFFADFQRRFYPTIGNHEQLLLGGRSVDIQAARRALDLVNVDARVKEIDGYGDYYFVHRNVHFLVMFASDEWFRQDRLGPWDQPEARQKAWADQFDWLFRRLSSIRQSQPDQGIVVMAHAGDWFQVDPNRPDSPRSLWAAALERYRVDLALAGDFHDYYAAAQGPTLKMRCGSAGYGVALYLDIEVYEKAMRITARLPDGTVLPYPLYGSCWRKVFGATPERAPCPR